MRKTINFLSAPCEIAVRKYVPSIRASIAIVLVRDYGLSIYRAAKLLKLTPAAVSNYLLKRRGGGYIDAVLNHKELYEMVSKIAEQIISGNVDEERIPLHICDICRKLRLKVEPRSTVPDTPC